MELHHWCRLSKRSYVATARRGTNMVGASREAVIDFEFLRGRQNETFVKELCVASATASKTFRFKIPYKMAGHTLLRTAYIGPTGI